MWRNTVAPLTNLVPTVETCPKYFKSSFESAKCAVDLSFYYRA